MSLEVSNTTYVWPPIHCCCLGNERDVWLSKWESSVTLADNFAMWWKSIYSLLHFSITDGVSGVCKLWNLVSQEMFRSKTTGCLTDQQVWFPVDFQETFARKFSRICNFIDIYRAESLTPGITLILFTQVIAQLKDIYQRTDSPNIN